MHFTSNNRTINSLINIGTPTTGYYALNSGTIEGDHYTIDILDLGDGGISAIQIKRNISAATDPGDLTFDFTEVTPFTGFSANAAGFNGLAYTPASGMPELVGYAVDYEQDRTAAPSNDDLVISYIITPNWLGGASSYTRPDFSSVLGSNSLWDLTSGYSTQARIVAAMFNVPLEQPIRMHTDWIPGLHMVQPGMLVTFTP